VTTVLGNWKSFVIKLTNENLLFGSRRVLFPRCSADHHLSEMLSTAYPVQIMRRGPGLTYSVMIEPSARSGEPTDGKRKPSKYTRFGTDLESFRDASQALPYVYKFFWMIYRLSPVRTMIIIAVFLIQGILPALRLRTGGDFIRQVFPPLTGV